MHECIFEAEGRQILQITLHMLGKFVTFVGFFGLNSNEVVNVKRFLSVRIFCRRRSRAALEAL